MIYDAANAGHAWIRYIPCVMTQGLPCGPCVMRGKATPCLRPIPCAAGTAYLGSNHRLRAAVQKGMEGRGMLKIGVVGRTGGA